MPSLDLPSFALRSQGRPVVEPKTVVVSGVARGGTSFVSSMLHHLGVPMGKGPPRYENPWLQKSIAAASFEVTDLIVQEINATHLIWGLKLPALIQHLDKIDGMLRNPHYIFIFKDPVAVALRKASNNGNDSADYLLQQLRRAIDNYQRIVRFCQTTQSPCLLLSYDRSMVNVADTIRNVVSYLGVDCADIVQVSDRMKADHRMYLNPVGLEIEWTELDRRILSKCRDRGVPQNLLRQASETESTRCAQAALSVDEGQCGK